MIVERKQQKKTLSLCYHLCVVCLCDLWRTNTNIISNFAFGFFAIVILFSLDIIIIIVIIYSRSKSVLSTRS